MPNFNGIVVTDAGKGLLAKAHQGKKLCFSKMQLGYANDTTNPAQKTAVTSPFLTTEIRNVKLTTDGSARISTFISNRSLTQPYVWREIGLFAKDPDTNEELLYAYKCAGDNGEVIPAGGGSDVIEEIFDIIIKIGDTTNITATIDESTVYISTKEFKEIVSDEYAKRLYEVGEYCIYNNILYRCIEKIEYAEDFNQEHWEQTTVTEELKCIDEDVVIGSDEPDKDRTKVWIKKGKNLFNSNNIISNANIISTGEISADSNSSINYVEVTPGEKYTMSSNVDRQWVLATSSTIPALGQTGTTRTILAGTSAQITIPNGHKYLLIRHYPSNNEDNKTQNIQIEQGNIATSYESYIKKEIYVKNDNGVFEKFVNVSDLEKQDTGWVDMSPYVNTDYFAVRPGDSSLYADERPMVRKIGNIVYWKGEIYCKNVPDTKQHIIAITGIPQMFIPDYQYSTSGCTYRDNSNYNMFIENGNIIISHADMMVTPTTMGYQLSNLSGYIVD